MALLQLSIIGYYYYCYRLDVMMIIVTFILLLVIESLELPSPSESVDENIVNIVSNDGSDGNHGNGRNYHYRRQIYCDLNPMCLCQNYQAQYMDVTCINVPFDSLPDLSRMMTTTTTTNESMINSFDHHHHRHLYRVRIHGARQLTQLNDHNSFIHLITLTSLSITNTRISWIDSNLFRNLAISRTLTTLDLSYGHLIDIPVDALEPLENLQWLSLQGNQIEIIKQNRFLYRLKHLRTLLLNENRLFIIDDGSFSGMPSLEQINFDSNMIERVEGNPFPSTLRSLSISNCLLRKIPFNSIESLSRLEILQLQGNLINHLSPFKLMVRRIQLIDLSHNLIDQIPDNLFVNFQSSSSVNRIKLKRNQNETRFTDSLQHSVKPASWTDNNNNNVDDRTNYNSLNESDDVFNDDDDDDDEGLQIEQLYLDFNFIKALDSTNLFRSIRLKKLSISNNRLSSSGLSNPAIFDGPIGHSLKILNVNYNLIDKYPRAFRSLTGLQQLLMKNNRIQTFDSANIFGQSSRTLELIDLSQNLIERIPTTAFNTLRNLIKLNLHDNAISRLDKDDLSGWCSQRLKSLTLSKNNLEYLSVDAFRSCRHLNELRLGGNRLLRIQPIQLAHYLNRLQLLDLSSLASVDWSYENLGNQSNQMINKFSHIKWLQFDFNQLHSIPNEMIDIFPGIKHLDLQNNLIDTIRTNQLSQLIDLQSIIISYNHLKKISTNSFSRLPRLESLTLYFNRIEYLDFGSFNELPRLQSLVLSRNQINHLEPGTFINISNESNSLTLLLDNNRIECLSIDPFVYIHRRRLKPEASSSSTFTTIDDDDDNNANDGQFAIYLNVSNNQIKTLGNCQNSFPTTTATKTNKNWVNIVRRRNQRDKQQKHQQTLAVRVLDLSSNQINELNRKFFQQFCPKTLSLLVNHNLIQRIPLQLFSLGYCSQLQSLSLNHNYIVDIKLAFDDDDDDNQTTLDNNDNSSFVIQTLSLQNNQIKDLSRFYRLFKRCSQLKSLYLNHNQIEWIPVNLWSETSIVTLNIANNKLTLDDDDTKTLKYLDLSNNLLRTIPKRIIFCDNLNELLLTNNQIYSFGKTFEWLNNDHSSLSILRLSNVISNNDKSNESLNIGESLNLPYLHTLDLSNNNILQISLRLLSRSRNVRHLNLATNQLREVPKHIWKYVTRLQWLSLRNNPIDILDSLSFAGLKYLRYLDIQELNLQYIDSRIFIYQSQMLSLKISTYPQIRSFRLQDILTKCDSLQTIVVDVREQILSHQIQWAFGGKLRELIITGRNLAVIIPDAFQGLNNANDLIVRITNTSVKHLPDSLLRYLADIRYITIDLRGNLLRTVSPSVFFTNLDNYHHSWKTWQSRQLLGGIILEDNPLVCDCNLLWLSQWMREVFTEMKSINVEAAIHAKSKLSLSQCARPLCYNNAQQYSSTSNITTTSSSSPLKQSYVSIIDLRDEDICQQQQQCQQDLPL
ncbi:Leucine Rich Repeat [Dermatophagoides pteronyssinus]|uniref:Leucine Rich Repeat n=1 Tax=Dermatophagoides pteronyssinus TaxID=6956 RepID=A0ABQ8IW60_DERPT|nr:Leucine Rich Repeat [Dermatophagoides pteronyssinus]